MIKAYIGRVGSGKTLNMVYDLANAMYRGRRVITNTPIECLFDPPFRVPHKLKAEFIPKGKDFLHALAYAQNCIIAVDEASIFLPSQFWNKLPPELLIKFAENRKFNCDIYYTTQGFGHTVKRLRDLTQIVHSCRGWWFGWKKLFMVRTFLPEFFFGMPTENKYKAYHLGNRILWPSPLKRAFKAYDTHYVVDTSAMMTIRERFEQPTWDGRTRETIQKDIDYLKSDEHKEIVKATEKFDILPDDLILDKTEEVNRDPQFVDQAIPPSV